MRRRFTRFKEEYFKHNLALVDALKTIADKKGVPVASLTIAWVSSLGSHVVPLPGSSYVTSFEPLHTSQTDLLASNAARVIENTRAGDIKLTEEESSQAWDIINNYEVKGDRYFGADPKAMHLWG